MNYVRLPILAALLLALFISGCSRTPAELSAPTLEPQFGTAADDYGIDVALASSNHVYALSKEFALAYDSWGDQNGFQAKALLKSYNSSGTLAWSKEIAARSCNWDYDDCYGGLIQPRSLHLDAKGNTYALISNGYIVDDSAYERSYSVKKLDAAGNIVRTIAVGKTGTGFESNSSQDFLSVGVDQSGAIYLAKRQYTYNYDARDTYHNTIAKYSTNGALLWQRTSTVGTPKGITVSSTSQVYVVGSSGISRYSSSGNLNWTKTGGGDAITVSGSNVYVRRGNTIRKHDSTGKQLWSKAQGGLSGMVIADMTADGNGNVYLTGKYAKTSTNRDAFFRKLSGSGSVVWTKVFGTNQYDDALGIATLNGSEIYVTGSTQGSLSHPNRGGSDGYLRKMDGSGNRVWTR